VPPEAVNVELYGTPTVPLGRLVVLIDRGPEQPVQAAIAIASTAVAWYPAASVTFMAILL
jgi:hypothetical protein